MVLLIKTAEVTLALAVVLAVLAVVGMAYLLLLGAVVLEVILEMAVKEIIVVMEVI
jgi:hypothetical protein